MRARDGLKPSSGGKSPFRAWCMELCLCCRLLVLLVWWCLLVLVLLRGTLVNRTYGGQKKLHIHLFLPTIFGPIYYRPP